MSATDTTTQDFKVADLSWPPPAASRSSWPSTRCRA